MFLRRLQAPVFMYMYTNTILFHALPRRASRITAFGQANSEDPDQSAPDQSDQCLHCLKFHLHLLNTLLLG